MENQRLQRILQENYEFKFGDYISKGFNLLGKNMGGYVGYTLILFLVLGLSGALSAVVPYVGDIISGYILGPAMIAGVYLVSRQIDLSERHEFSDFFGGFQHIGQLILVTLVTTLITYLALIPFGLANMALSDNLMNMITDPQNRAEYIMDLWGNIPAWSYLLLLPMIYFSVAYAWAPMFVIFHKLSFWDAMEASRTMITKKWFIFFLFMITTSIIMAGGILGLCIGVLFTFPAAMAMHYAAFADATQLNHTDDEMDITDHLIDDIV